MFCAHGGGTTVKWDRVDALCDLETGRDRARPAAPRPRMQRLTIDEAESGGDHGARVRADPPADVHPPRRTGRGRAGARLSGAEGDRRHRRYNVIFAWDELKALAADSLDAARTRLAEILVNYNRGFTGSDVVLVFDGYAVKGQPLREGRLPRHPRGVHEENESADIYIQKLVHDIGKNDAVRVVTSDR